jgi:hypothetical protein
MTYLNTIVILRQAQDEDLAYTFLMVSLPNHDKLRMRIQCNPSQILMVSLS